MKLKGLFVSLVLTFILTGCVSEFDAQLPSGDTQLLIVDGSIEANTEVTFHLSKSYSLNYSLNDSVRNEIFIDNATLTLIDGNKNEISQAENTGKGQYKMFVGDLNENTVYGIRIEYGGEIYESTPSKPLRAPEIDGISWTQPEKYGSVFFRISTHDDTQEAKFFLWNYTEDWEVNAKYEAYVIFNPITNKLEGAFDAPYYRCWKTYKSNRFLIGSTESHTENKITNKDLYSHNPENDDYRFSAHYCVTVSQKAISREAFEYYQNKLKQAENMGGLFTPQPSEIIGNLSCITDPAKKVIGYINVSKNTSQKRLFLQKELANNSIRPHCTEEQKKQSTSFDDCNCESFQEASSRPLPFLSESDMYKYGYLPIGYRLERLDGTFYAGWAKKYCADCREKGGTTNKPDFFPDIHE